MSLGRLRVAPAPVCGSRASWCASYSMLVVCRHGYLPGLYALLHVRLYTIVRRREPFVLLGDCLRIGTGHKSLMFDAGATAAGTRQKRKKNETLALVASASFFLLAAALSRSVLHCFCCFSWRWECMRGCAWGSERARAHTHLCQVDTIFHGVIT